MFRTTRTRVSLVRSLVLGTASTATLAAFAASTVLVACANENEPEYWIEKLPDPAWKARSIKRLGQFYEDGLSKANKDENAPEVKALVEKLVGPMTNIYVADYDNLDENTREDLMRQLAGFRDPRTEPALKKALEEFGKKGRGGKDVKWASRAVRDMKLKSVAPDVLASFKKMKPSTKDGAYYRDFNEALVVVADPAWGPELVEILNQDFPMLDPTKKDPNAVNDYKDALYQTVTAVQLLGDAKVAAAVEPLIKIVLDPVRVDAGNEALLALTKIGKPAAEMAVQLLEGKLPALQEYQKKQIQKKNNLQAPPAGDLHLAPAAMILGAIGRPEGVAPLTKAIADAKEDGDKAQFLATLAMMPHTKEVLNTFTEGFKDLPEDASGPGGNVLQTLAEPAALTFDSSFVPTLLERASVLAKEKDANAGIVPASTLLLSAIKLMDASQVGKVSAAVKKAAAAANKEPAVQMFFRSVTEALENASKLTQKCGTDAECYLSAAKDPANQTQKTQMTAMKAIFAYAQLKGPASVKVLAEAMPSFEEASIRYTAAQAIDHHSPTGNEEVAKALEAIVDKRKDSPDRAKVAADKPVRDVVYRLKARAQ
jgi:hypothetical protein